MASRPPRAPVRVSDVLSAALPGLGDHLVVERIRARWGEVVGRDGSRRSRPESLRQGVLTVAVDGSAWLQELTLRSTDLLARAQGAHGRAVTGLRFVLGRMPAASAPGRAPSAGPDAVPRLTDEDRRDIEQLTAAIADPALAAALGRLLTKDRLARVRAGAHASGPRERHDA